MLSIENHISFFSIVASIIISTSRVNFLRNIVILTLGTENIQNQGYPFSLVIEILEKKQKSTATITKRVIVAAHQAVPGFRA